ncbi:MAG: Ig-like domain-containing protein [Burkholderiales bacterium]|nr:Ig-like domain-containing protein [Burkholderiales bacterium]MDE2276758.1 Ig-like domain-containing protein [Burkholderiales bacterium]
MPFTFTRRALAAAAFALVAPLALAGGVSVRFDAGDPAGSPFPSNRYTVFDGSQNTLRRVALPQPDCVLRPNDCADVAVLNQLDGFSTQPRITVPFTGDIDPASVSSDTIYLVSLGDTLSGRGYGTRVGINQIVWDPASKTLAFESDALLQQHTRYLLVVTDGVHDAQGRPLKARGWGRVLGDRGDHGDQGDDADRGDDRDRDDAGDRQELRTALQSLHRGRRHIVAASVFTTQSISADLVKIEHRIQASTPAPVDFVIGSSGGAAVRALFPLAAVQGMVFNRETGTAPAFTPSPLPLGALGVVPGAIASVAYGRFASADYETAAKFIPATGTLTGQPQPQGTNQLIVQVFLPAGPKPAGGWPVMLFGHGFTDSMYGAPWTVASVMASAGIATVSLNVVGHGGGPLGTLAVQEAGSTIVVPAGGRGIDQDGNGRIDSTEGVNAAAPQTLLASRDGLRQTVADYLQLVRQIQAGIDVDGDGSVDLDAGRIYYAGQSFGGIYGPTLTAVEPAIKAAVFNVPGGSVTEIARLSPIFRPLTGLALLQRQPSLLNLAPTPALPVPLNFNENEPLRDQPPVVNTVPGAMAIQAYIDRAQWATQAGNPVAYAPFLRREPLPGIPPRPVIVQFAKGDMTVPNPTASAVIRAGALADRATYFRNDLAFAANNAVGRNPHTFLTNIANPAQVGYAVLAQRQIATFFATGGAVTVDPDGAGPYFEVPIAGPLPETLNFIP